jgi:hypothetical protein
LKLMTSILFIHIFSVFRLLEKVKLIVFIPQGLLKALHGQHISLASNYKPLTFLRTIRSGVKLYKYDRSSLTLEIAETKEWIIVLLFWPLVRPTVYISDDYRL